MDGLEGENGCELHIWPVSEKPKPEVLVRWQPEYGAAMSANVLTMSAPEGKTDVPREPRTLPFLDPTRTSSEFHAPRFRGLARM
jgi:hypothetical protein